MSKILRIFNYFCATFHQSTTFVSLFTNIIINMNKRRLRLATLVCSVAVCGFGLTSCAEDWDDFFTQHADDIAARDAEDAAIRADLQTEINNLRTEITGKIANVEGKLHDLIEQGGQDVLNDLATKSQQTRTTIDTRYSQFTALMNSKFGDFQTTVNNIFTQFDTKRQQLEQELQTAIGQNNQTRANEIQQFINDVKAMQSQVQSGVAQINALQTEYAALIAQADQLQDLEQRMQTQSERYDDMLDELPGKIQEAEEKFEAAKDADISNLSAAEIQDYKDKLADMRDKFAEMETALQKLQEMYADAQDLVQKLSDLADEADNLSNLLSDISDAYDKYSDAEDILNRIDAVDISQYEGLYDSLKEDLETAHSDMAAAFFSLNSVTSELNSTHSYFEKLADDCEWQANYAELLSSEIEAAFNNIPFPN